MLVRKRNINNCRLLNLMKTFFAATLVATANSHATGYEHTHEHHDHHNLAYAVPAPVSEYYAPVNDYYSSQVPHGDFYGEVDAFNEWVEIFD